MSDIPSRTKPTSPKRSNIFYQAQAILSRRDHSQHEVRQKLQRKGFGGQQIDEVVAWLAGKRLLDDEAFAEVYVQSILRSKAVGPRWLHYKLKQKGIASDVIERTVAAAFAQESEDTVARRAATDWQRRQTKTSADRQRLTRFLASRGFSTAVIQTTVASKDISQDNL